MSASRRMLALVLVALLPAMALAACGGDSDGGGGETAVMTTGTGASADATTATNGRRTIEHAMGTTELEGTPQRVVVLDTPELDLATTLGVRPAGTVEADTGTGVPEYLAEQARGIPTVGTIEEPNLIEIARLRPDLILGSKVRHEKLYDQLDAIAPTVFTETPSEWKANIATNAAALGKLPQAQELLDDYERRAQLIGERLGSASDVTVSVVRFLPGEIRLYSPRSFVGSVLQDVGVQVPRAAAEADDISATLSLENLDQADADVVYTTVWGPQRDTDMAQAQRLPSWRGLRGVRSGDVHEEPDDVWMLGIGVTGAGHVLDELERTLPRA